jgi:hypothetical protein
MKRCLVIGLRFVMVEGTPVTAAYRLSGYGYPSPYSGKLVNNRYGLPVASVARLWSADGCIRD